MPLFIYLLILLISSSLADSYVYSLFQVVSLISVIVFGIAVFSRENRREECFEALLNASFYSYLLVLIAGLLLAKLMPSLAYSIEYSGDRRFTGIFYEPATMGGVAAISLGLGLFMRKHYTLRILMVVLSVASMGLTLSRTYWIAAFIGTGVVMWFYLPRINKLMISGLVLAVCLLSFAGSFADLSFMSGQVKNIVRLDSVSKMSGRTEMWKRALESAELRPYLGYGFSVGAEYLNAGHLGSDYSGMKSLRRTIRGATLHSGYVQAILDCGALGFLFYSSSLLTTLWFAVRSDRSKMKPILIYILLFFALSNCAETMIYTAADFTGVFFWLASAFALTAPGAKFQEQGDTVVSVPQANIVV